MNKQTKDNQPQDEITKLRQSVADLEHERLESLKQLRLGASSDVRQPSRIRRQIATALTKLRQLELAKTGEGA